MISDEYVGLVVIVLEIVTVILLLMVFVPTDVSFGIKLNVVVTDVDAVYETVFDCVTCADNERIDDLDAVFVLDTCRDFVDITLIVALFVDDAEPVDVIVVVSVF